MPTYDYKCDACGHAFEQFQSITAAALKKCPTCGQNKLKRLIGTGAGVIFKGGGFYQTDYRSDTYKAAAKQDNNGGGEPAGAGEKGDSKSGEKSDAKSDVKSTGKSESPAPAVSEAKSDPKPAPTTGDKSSRKRKSA